MGFFEPHGRHSRCDGEIHLNTPIWLKQKQQAPRLLFFLWAYARVLQKMHGGLTEPTIVLRCSIAHIQAMGGAPR